MKRTTCDSKFSYECPYLVHMKSGKIRCEFASITPPDKTARKEFLKDHCGSSTCYKECPFYKIMDDYYRRYYSTEVVKW